MKAYVIRRNGAETPMSTKSSPKATQVAGPLHTLRPQPTPILGMTRGMCTARRRRGHCARHGSGPLIRRTRPRIEGVVKVATSCWARARPPFGRIYAGRSRRLFRTPFDMNFDEACTLPIAIIHHAQQGRHRRRLLQATERSDSRRDFRRRPDANAIASSRRQARRRLFHGRSRRNLLE